MNTIQEQIKEFWNENPVGTNFIDEAVGKKFFLDYDRIRYSMEGHILEELKSTDWKGKRVLEIGLGQGSDAMQIILAGGIYSGIDITEESIFRVKERFSAFDLPHEDLLLADARRIPFADDSFDIVFSHGVLHHSPFMPEIIDEIYRILKPGGQVIFMVYHKNSINYWLNIFLIRRLGLLMMLAYKPLVKIISRLTGEAPDRIAKHLKNYRKAGPAYLSMKNFIHKSTDGPDNVYSSVWTKSSIKPLLKSFSSVKFKVHYLNERHLLGFQKLLPKRFKNFLSNNFGWHLWAYGNKE